MGLMELFLTAVALSMDAFAVSVCKGLSVKELKFRHSMSVGLFFGGFQALMPLIGFILGVQFERFISDFDHWVAFILLGIIGINMIKDSREGCEADDSFSFKTMFVLAVATSIDALAVGVMFAIIKADILKAVALIGAITFSLSVVGIKVGNIFGARFKSKAEIAGGVILVFMGFKILIEHLFLS